MQPAPYDSRPRSIRLVALALATLLALVLVACSSGGGEPGADSDSTQVPAQAGEVEALTRGDVEEAVAAFIPLAEEAMATTGVPGLAFAVVFDDQVVAAEGLGVRELGQPEPIDAETVFQLASLSKPLASTVVAGLVGQGHLAWDDPVSEVDPGFELADPWVADHVTYADLFSHRSGLPDHAGDLLEDLGYDRAQVLERLRLEPLQPFRSSYAYTNFGLTEAGVAAATAAGLSWEEAADRVLYEPLGMASTSSRFSDYLGRANRAVPHVQVDGTWQVTHLQRQPDAQSPAGGVSSNVTDLAQWLRLQLGQGSVAGAEVVGADALAETHLPHNVASPPPSTWGRPGFYGLGWNVGYDDGGRLRLSHSGAFGLGAGTMIDLVPSEGLGIVVLTNGEPTGLADAMAKTFNDLVLTGSVQRDWLSLYAPFYQEMVHPTPDVDYTEAPTGAAPPRDLAAYVGDYANDYYGPARVAVEGGALVLELGPRPERFILAPYDGDTFWFQPIGENAGPPTDAAFAVDAAGGASLTVGWLDETGLGTFTRS
jgi:CubicO group peptidase (beta-lactamase class C family)